MRSRRYFAESISLAMSVVLTFSGCAPAGRTVDERFVTNPELQAIALTREGLSALSRGRYRDAELSFERALSLFPEAENVRRNLARALLLGGDGAGAEREYRRLLVKGVSAPLQLDLAQALLLQEREDEALEIFQSVYALGVSRGDNALRNGAALNLATTYFKRGQEEEASCWLSEVLGEGADIRVTERATALLVALNRPGDAAIAIERASPQGGVGATPQLLLTGALAAFARGDEPGAHHRALEGLKRLPSGEAQLRRELETIVALAGDSVEGRPLILRETSAELGVMNSRALYLPPRALMALERRSLE